MLAATLSALGGGRESVSDVEVIRRAKELGMSFPEERRLELGNADRPADRRETAAAGGESAPPIRQAPGGREAGRRAEVVVVVPPGATAGEVARLLKGKSLIADEGEFLRLAAAKGGEPRFLPGTYRLPRDITVRSLIGALLTGPQAD